MPFEAILSFCLENAFDALEIEITDTNFDPALVEEATLARIRGLSEEGKLIFALHSPGDINFSDSDPDRRREAEQKVMDSLRLAAQLKARTVVVHPGRVPGEFNKDNWLRALEQNIAAIQRCADLAKSLGVSLSVENLCHEKGSVNPNIHKFREMCESIGLSRIDITLDTNHAGLVDGLMESISVVGPYVNHVHFSSNKGERSDHCTPQEGVMDFHAAADFLGSFQGIIMIELNARGEASGDALLQTRDYLVDFL